MKDIFIFEYLLYQTVSISDYGNAIAHGSLAGEVQTAFANQLLIGMDVDRSVAKKRRVSLNFWIIKHSEKITLIKYVTVNFHLFTLYYSSVKFFDKNSRSF